ncbi:hypothetical protein OG474_30600 [Kribbella sp. NBC_01505]|uniref:hypothetical protein n=1 Tax=Kribbella sp. NBC_01505 TaxID=2903580 RepID=UPI00387058C6
MPILIVEAQDFRVQIKHEEGAAEPYFDGSSPLLRWRWGISRHEAEQVTAITAYKVDDSILQALRRWGDDRDYFERYLRIYHGTRSIIWNSGVGLNHQYVTFDTADWRAWVDVTDEWLNQQNQGGSEPPVLADMSDYEAYLRGETYGWVAEKKTRWIKVDATGTPIQLDDETYREEWEYVESCWGFYSLDSVEQAARQELAELSGEPAEAAT